jgi:hypothetical protein
LSAAKGADKGELNVTLPFHSGHVWFKLDRAWWRSSVGPATRGFGTISMHARSDDPAALEAEHSLLSHRLAALREAIVVLEQADTLRSDASARLAMYRQNEARLALEIQVLERALVRREWLREGEDGGETSDLVGDLLEQLAADRAARDAGT